MKEITDEILKEKLSKSPDKLKIMKLQQKLDKMMSVNKLNLAK